MFIFEVRGSKCFMRKMKYWRFVKFRNMFYGKRKKNNISTNEGYKKGRKCNCQSISHGFPMSFLVICFVGGLIWTMHNLQ